jgi:hypothetical protein
MPEGAWFMAWSYELRGSDNRLVEMRRGFATKREAEAAARSARRMMEAFDFPAGDKEDLTIVTKDEAAE